MIMSVEICETILFGVLSSLFASIIFVVVSQLWNWNAKSDIKNYVNRSKELFYAAELRFSYDNDYSDIMLILRDAQKYLVSAYEHFRFFTYFWSPKQRRVMYTLIYDLLRVCERASFITVGHTGSTEAEARLREIEKMFEAPDPQKWRCSLVSLKCDLLIALLNKPNWKSLWLVLNDNIEGLVSKDVDYITSFVDANSYKANDKEPIKSKGITRKEFASIFRQYAN